MFLFNFSKFAGPDKVFKVVNSDNFPKKVKAGDRIVCGEDEFLALGDKVSFAELYTYTYTPNQKMEIIYPGLLSPKILELVHRMVYTYYSTYKSVMKYFLSDEVESLLKREAKSSKPKAKSSKEKTDKPLDAGCFLLSATGQTLIVFPDLRTLFNMTNETFLGNKHVALLTSNSTANQKDKNRRDIKKGNVSVIISTHGEIFQDYADLQKIIFLDPYKRYYANQQDPRYKAEAVLEEMKRIYGCELEVLSV